MNKCKLCSKEIFTAGKFCSSNCSNVFRSKRWNCKHCGKKSYGEVCRKCFEKKGKKGKPTKRGKIKTRKLKNGN